jgi:hypothetical protein
MSRFKFSILVIDATNLENITKALKQVLWCTFQFTTFIHPTSTNNHLASGMILA